MVDQPNPFASPQTAAGERPEIVFATEHPEALRKVKLGLTLVYTGICGTLIAAISAPVMLLFFQADDSAAIPALVIGGMVALALLMFVGQVFCIAIPAESGAKGLVVTAVALQAIGFLTSLGSLMVPVPASVGAIVSVVNNLAGFVAVAFFVLFLRRVAIYLSQPNIAGRATRTLIVGAIAGVLLTAGSALVIARPDTAVVLAPPLAIAGIAGFVALVMYANTVTYLRKAIRV